MNKKEQYSLEFRQEAVKLVTEQGLSLSEASRRLGIPKGTLGHWVAMSRKKGEAVPAGNRTVAELEQENARLRQDLAEARLEREILKKAMAYFAKESLPGTRS